MANDAALAMREQGTVRPQQPNVPTLDFSAIPPDIMARAAQIAADVMANGGTINPAQALTAAYHFANTGEVMGRHSYVGTKGNVSGRVLEGYRAVARELDMSRYQWYFRPLTPDEEKMHTIQPGDRALACSVDVLAARRQCIDMGIEYHPVVGITVIRKGEPLNVPKNRTAMWVMQKQCKNDALRQLGENTEADEVLAEAGISDAPDGYMSVEQAEAMVRERIAEALRQANPPTPQEVQARAAANVKTMRAPAGFQGFGDEPEPGGTAEHAPLISPTKANGHAPAAPTADEQFEQMTSASQERAAQAEDAKPHRDMAGMTGAAAKEFPAWCVGFVSTFPYYAKSGRPDMPHILRTVASDKVGFADVTPANIAQVCEKLTAYAERQAALGEAEAGK
jgi:hypothetical protein